MSPTFLDRAAYRRRRMRDALRVLPVVGGGLWLVPMLWPLGVPTSAVLLFVFSVWLGLMICAALLGRRAEG